MVTVIMIKFNNIINNDSIVELSEFSEDYYEDFKNEMIDEYGKQVFVDAIYDMEQVLKSDWIEKTHRTRGSKLLQFYEQNEIGQDILEYLQETTKKIHGSSIRAYRGLMFIRKKYIYHPRTLIAQAAINDSSFHATSTSYINRSLFSWTMDKEIAQEFGSTYYLEHDMHVDVLWIAHNIPVECVVWSGECFPGMFDYITDSEFIIDHSLRPFVIYVESSIKQIGKGYFQTTDGKKYHTK
jgi:hypothetical protein